MSMVEQFRDSAGELKSRVTFFFTGGNFSREDIPEDVTHITFGPEVESVDDGAFYGLKNLQEVMFNEGLIVIGTMSFAYCPSLKNLVFPSSIKTIGEKAFFCCIRLRTIHFKDDEYDACRKFSSLEGIEHSAFRKCRSLLRVDLPDSLDMIGAFGETVFHGCDLLHNVHSNSMATCYTDGVTGFKGRFPRLGQVGCDYGSCQDRFAHSDINRWCFYHSYFGLTDEEAVKDLQDNIEYADISSDDDLIDCLGMTPLHNLASSAKHRIELYRILFERSPGDLVTKDKWGLLPMDYALFNEAPEEVIQFFFVAHNEKGGMPYHLDQIIEMILHEVATSPTFISRIIQIHSDTFPDEDIDWTKLVNALAEYPYKLDDDILRKLVPLSLQSKFEALEPVQRSEMKGYIEAITHEDMTEQLDLLHSILTVWELQESTTILELALWKAKLDGGGDDEVYQDREACRVKSGADVIIKGVLQFFQYNSNARRDFEELAAASDEGEDYPDYISTESESVIEIQVFDDEFIDFNDNDNEGSDFERGDY